MDLHKNYECREILYEVKSEQVGRQHVTAGMDYPRRDKSQGLADETFCFQGIPPRYMEYFSVTMLQRGNYLYSRGNSLFLKKHECLLQ